MSKKSIPIRLMTAPVEEGLRGRMNVGDQVFAFGKAYRVIGFRGDRAVLVRKTRTGHGKLTKRQIAIITSGQDSLNTLARRFGVSYKAIRYHRRKVRV
jgi:hypothetical protein